MDDSTDMVASAADDRAFLPPRSCGQCTPCREGTGWLETILDRIDAGEGTEADIAKLDSVAASMMGTTICVLSDAAAMPVQSFLKKFRHEFSAKVKTGRAEAAA
jgi:NADH-quinone oxidoreductase subunit F